MSQAPLFETQQLAIVVMCCEGCSYCSATADMPTRERSFPPPPACNHCHCADRHTYWQGEQLGQVGQLNVGFARSFVCIIHVSRDTLQSSRSKVDRCSIHLKAGPSVRADSRRGQEKGSGQSGCNHAEAGSKRSRNVRILREHAFHDCIGAAVSHSISCSRVSTSRTKICTHWAMCQNRGGTPNMGVLLVSLYIKVKNGYPHARTDMCLLPSSGHKTSWCLGSEKCELVLGQKTWLGLEVMF